MQSDVSDPLKPLEEVKEADGRQGNLTQSLPQLHASLASLVLHTAVPPDVRQLFETAKNVRLYTYFVYRFHQVAEIVAYQALERGLKHRWNNEMAHLPTIDDPDYVWPGLSALMADAGHRGWVRNEGFSSRAWRAERALISERSKAAVEAMQATGDSEYHFPDPTRQEIEARIPKVDVVRILVELLPKLRNSLAHGSARLTPTSDLVLQDVCDALNMIFDGTPSAPAATPSHAKFFTHKSFKQHLAHLEPRRIALLSMSPVSRNTLPQSLPSRGVYLFSEQGRHLYVGRTNGMRKRILMHSGKGARQNMAAFAFRLAKEQCGVGPATYKKGTGRAELALRSDVAEAFLAAKARIRNMEVRFVEEVDPMRQMLLEAYVAVVHSTPYNDFENH